MLPGAVAQTLADRAMLFEEFLAAEADAVQAREGPHKRRFAAPGCQDVHRGATAAHIVRRNMVATLPDTLLDAGNVQPQIGTVNIMHFYPVTGIAGLRP